MRASTPRGLKIIARRTIRGQQLALAWLLMAEADFLWRAVVSLTITAGMPRKI